MTTAKQHRSKNSKIRRLPSRFDKPTTKKQKTTIHDEKWEKNYNVLCAYAQARRQKDPNGYWDGHVPQKTVINDENEPGPGRTVRLGSWSSNQRSSYRNGEMSEERVNKLKQIGLKLNTSHEDTWGTMYNALCHFAQGLRSLSGDGYWDGNVPRLYMYQQANSDEPALPLGKWVGMQRTLYKRGTICQERIDKLEGMGLRLKSLKSLKW